MARSGIHYEDVKDAAETLMGRGLPPTIQRVRELLGTGSNTTISEHLKRWHRQMAEAPKAILPPTIPDVVMTALDPFCKIAMPPANAAFDEQRKVAMQTVSEAEQIRQAAIIEQRQAQAEANELRQHLDVMQINAHDLAERLLVEQERRAAAEAAIQAAEQRVQTAIESVAQIRAETEARIAQLEAALLQLRLDKELQLAQAQQRLDGERQRGEANEARLMQLLDRDRAEHAAERKIFATEREDWKNHEITWQNRLDVQQRENTVVRTALAAAEERQRGLDAENQQLRATLQTAEQHYIDAMRIAEILRSESKTALDEQYRLRQLLEKVGINAALDAR